MLASIVNQQVIINGPTIHLSFVGQSCIRMILNRLYYGTFDSQEEMFYIINTRGYSINFSKSNV